MHFYINKYFILIQYIKATKKNWEDTRRGTGRSGMKKDLVLKQHCERFLKIFMYIKLKTKCKILSECYLYK